MEIETSNEVKLLGLLLKSPEMMEHCTKIKNISNPFSSANWNNIWNDMSAIYEKTGSIDKRSLMLLGKDKNIPFDLYAGIQRSAGMSIETRDLVESVFEAHSKRLLSVLGFDIVDCVKDEVTPLESILNRCDSTLEGIRKAETVTQGVSSAEAIQQVYDEIEALKSKDDSVYLKTGIQAIDRLIHGLKVGSMSVIGARPAVGKTAMALTIMSNMAAANIGTGFISAEMGESDLYARIAQIRSGACMMDFAHSNQGENVFYQHLDFMANDNRLQIVNTTDRQISNIRSIARKMKINNPNLKVIFIDYIQKLRAKGDGMRDQITEVSAILTDMTKDLGIHICALAQLNREGDGVPEVKHLKESGAIEQDAHLIILMHRDKDKQLQGELDTEAYAKVAKNRGGLVGLPEIRYNCKTTRFYDQYARTI